MPFEIIYGQGALDAVLALSMPTIVDCVEANMNRLADDPLGLSRRGRTIFPLADGKVFRPQEFDFHCHSEPGRAVHFRAYFHFEQTERELQVIGVVPRPYLVL
jgi:hypothetical protein